MAKAKATAPTTAPACIRSATARASSTSAAYDFKGNLLESRRDLLPDYKQAVDWLQNPAANDGSFTSQTTYDALNRPLTVTSPDGSVYRPTFNEANLLDKVEVNLRGSAVATSFVTNINYNAKGQRELIDYGNGVGTSYDYDPLTFRLIHLQTLRGVEHLQDLCYTYDPVGNITAISDDAQQTIYFNNQVVEPHADYTYDAIYRLIEATGREHIGQASQPQTTWDDQFRVHLPQPNDGQAMRRYTEQYEYDEVGNFLHLIHQAQNGDWTRGYSYNEHSLLEPGKDNNRLSRPQSARTTETYTYDAHGNMTSMPHLARMEWDFKDQFQPANLGGGGTAYYVYDAAGQRTRKVIERQNGTRQKERIYLGGFEVYREYNGDGRPSRWSGRPCISWTTSSGSRWWRPARYPRHDPMDPRQLIRYQFGNHLGSASLELDEQAQIISYEEYTPYGSTSYQAVRSQTETPKRYRYTGKERDEESGLYYHGARYYAAWLGRWTSCDPADLGGTDSVYGYVGDNPIIRHDPQGMQECPVYESIVCSNPTSQKCNEAMAALEQRQQACREQPVQPSVVGDDTHHVEPSLRGEFLLGFGKRLGAAWLRTQAEMISNACLGAGVVAIRARWEELGAIGLATKRRFTQLTARVGDLEDSLGGVLDVRARCWSLLTSSWHEKNRSISLLHRCALTDAARSMLHGSEYAPWMVNLTSGRRPVHPPRNRCWRKLDRRSRNWSASALGKNGRFGNSRNGCWYSCSAWAVC